ncbi:MAG: hypothetical protein KIH08_05580 [Candidatus Freyarchaeota archaeon]|nr:hypothetical protein [Candidatus Jordarchaeia archaeon]MBS7268513.1 hypothetical protein [Candidatus Jordarchaeia archaeon]MBS7279026.1 hypothetical protein [Candidatus Jordarchaeia archaeon]
MVDAKPSDFVMFETGPFKEPDLISYLALVTSAIGEEAKTYGPVFTVRFIKNTSQYLTEKFGVDVPEDIKTIEQLGQYIVSIHEKHKEAYKAFMYAHFKTENEFLGQTGAGARVGAIGFYKDKDKKSIEERNVDIDALLTSYRQTMIALKVSTLDLGYKKNGDGSVNVLWPNCYFSDICRYTLEKGLLRRPDGRLQCTHSVAMIQFFKLTTGYEWDYTILEYNKPHCIVKAYMI